jgi:hypothetical protein
MRDPETPATMKRILTRFNGILWSIIDPADETIVGAGIR